MSFLTALSFGSVLGDLTPPLLSNLEDLLGTGQEATDVILIETLSLHTAPVQRSPSSPQCTLPKRPSGGEKGEKKGDKDEAEEEKHQMLCQALPPPEGDCCRTATHVAGLEDSGKGQSLQLPEL